MRRIRAASLPPLKTGPCGSRTGWLCGGICWSVRHAGDSVANYCCCGSFLQVLPTKTGSLRLPSNAFTIRCARPKAVRSRTGDKGAPAVPSDLRTRAILTYVGHPCPSSFGSGRRSPQAFLGALKSHEKLACEETTCFHLFFSVRLRAPLLPTTILSPEALVEAHLSSAITVLGLGHATLRFQPPAVRQTVVSYSRKMAEHDKPFVATAPF